jgi:arylsulfatase A
MAALALAGVVCGGGGSVTPVPTPTATPPPAPPNFVFILADDMGYGDVGSYGGTISTPNLDQMAAQGVRFTSYYAASVCAPSRAALMTGRWGIRAGVPWNPPIRLNDGEITVADALHGLGYTTGMVGKWHLGWVPADFPTHHGFDTYYGSIGGEDELDGVFVRGDQQTTDPADVVPTAELTARYTQEAVSWIRSHKDKPFFFYLAYRDPHLPLFGAYDAIVHDEDAAVGQVMQALRDAGVDQNTLVIFSSDNGPPGPCTNPKVDLPAQCSNALVGSTGPLSGRKGGIGEGAVRMPAIAWWPARIPGGRVLDQPVANLDIFPTFVALAGGHVPTDRIYDGVDISKLLTGQATRLSGPGIGDGRELMYWSSSTPAAIRSGNYKYVRKYSNGSSPALYDLEADISEHHDLLNETPDLQKIGQQLDQRIDELSAGLP